MNKDIYNLIKEYYDLLEKDKKEASRFYYLAQLDTLTQQDWKDYKNTLKK